MLVFSGIPDEAEKDPETMVKEFIQTDPKLPEDTMTTISFPLVHLLGGKRLETRLIVAKFEHFQQKIADEEPS